MANPLTGSLHKSATFTRKNWRGLFEVTIIPMAILVALAIGYLALFIPVFNDIFQTAINANQNPDAIDPQKFMSNMMKIQGYGLFAGLLSVFIMALSSVRIVRFYVHGEHGLWVMNKEIAKASGMWALYSIAINIIAMFASMLAMIPLMLISSAIFGFLNAILGPGTLSAIISGIGGFLTMLAMMLILFGLLLRFASGLPVVALGKTPNLFKDMWVQSKGLTFALAGRAMAIYLILTLIYFIIFAVISAGAFYSTLTAIMQPDVNQNPELIFTLLKQMMPKILMAEAIITIIAIPVYWWVIVWLSEVNRRLYAKRSNDLKQVS